MTVRVIALLLLVAFAALGLPALAVAQPVGDVFRQVSPSVVVIRSRGRDVSASGPVRFGEIGSGVLVSADGKVMTAAHVVHSVDEITVEFIGGEAVKARVVASEPAADLSLLQLDRVPAGVKVARLADSSSVRVGDQVMVVGAPYGLAYSLSVGYISARWPPNSVYPAFPLAEFFQTDASINTGNSGGPLFSMTGEVVGIVSHNISKSGGSEGLGFVVTINTARIFCSPGAPSGPDSRATPSRATWLRSSTCPSPKASWSRPWPRTRPPRKWGSAAGTGPRSSTARRWWSAETSCSRSTASPPGTSPTITACASTCSAWLRVRPSR